MILPDFQLPSRVNHCCLYSGIDSYDYCMDKQHFLQYPYRIIYQFNSRGFRDSEWPSHIHDLQKAIWCVGDSFTVGIGQPFDHTWPQVLQRAIGSRVINVSMDGASNDWISRRARQIREQIDPLLIVVMWSYTHRREQVDSSRNDEDRRIATSRVTDIGDFKHWIKLVKSVRNDPGEIIECTIPLFCPITEIANAWNSVRDPSWGDLPQDAAAFDLLNDRIKQELQTQHQCFDRFENFFRNLDPTVSMSDLQMPSGITQVRSMLDWARDYHHFDILTSEWVVARILVRIRERNLSKNFPLVASVEQ